MVLVRKRRRLVRALGLSVAGLVLFVAAVIAGALVHLNLPPARQALSMIANHALRNVLQGSIRVEHVGDAGLYGVENVHAVVLSPAGVPVIHAQHVDVHAPVLNIVRSALIGNGPIQIPLDRVSIKRVRVRLEQAPDGEPTFVQALEPPPSTEPKQPGRDVILVAPEVRIDVLDAQGSLLEMPRLKAHAERLHGSVHVDSEQTIVNLQPVEVSAEGLPVPPVAGRLEGSLVIPSEDDGRFEAVGALDIRVGQVPVTLHGSLDGDRVAAYVDVHRSSAQALQQIVPLHAPAEAHVQVHGTLPHLQADGTAAVGEGKVSFQARAHLGQQSNANLQLEFQNLQAQSFDPEAPPASVSGQFEATAQIGPNEAVQGSYLLQTQPTAIGQDSVPPLRARGRFTKQFVEGRLEADEPGAQLAVDYDVRLPEAAGDDTVVNAQVDATVSSFAQFARLQTIDQGSATVRARGHVRLGASPRLDAEARVTVRNIQSQEARVGAGELQASIQGSLDEPELRSSFVGRQVGSGPVTLDRLAVDVRGPARAPRLVVRGKEGNNALDAQAQLDFRQGVRAQKVQVQAQRFGVPVSVQVQEVAVLDGHLAVRQGLIRGLGQDIAGDFEQKPDGFDLRAQAGEVQLTKVAQFLGLRPEEVQGTASLQADIRTQDRHMQGQLQARVQRAGYKNVQGGYGDLKIAMQGRTVDVAAQAGLEQALQIIVESEEVRLPGDPMAVASWREATGKVQAVARANIDNLARRLPEQLGALGDSSGEVAVHAALHRDRTGDFPSLDVSAASRGLDLLLHSDPEPGQAGQSIVQTSPQHLRGVDVAATLRVEGPSGQVTIDSQLVTANRPLAELEAQAQLPVRELLVGEASWNQALTSAPLQATLTVPRQRLGRLPEAFRPAELDGQMEAKIKLEGTAKQPQLAMLATAYDVRGKSGAASRIPPMDFRTSVRYDRDQGLVELTVRDPQKVVAEATSEVTFFVNDLFDKPGQVPRWKASADVALDGLPLQFIGVLAGVPLKGCTFGRVILKDWNDNASFAANLEVDGLRVGEAPFRTARAALQVQDGRMIADALLEQPRGRLSMRAESGVDWGARLVPEPVSSRAAGVTIAASNFRLLPVREFVDAGEVDGIIDGQLQVKASEQQSTHVEGALRLRQGVLDAAVIGQRLHGISADIVAAPNGEIRIHPVTIEGVNGRIQAAAAVRMEGMRFQTAAGTVVISDRNAIPVTYEGVDYGEASGRMQVRVVRVPGTDTMDVDVEVPRLHVMLPQSSSQKVQPLEDEPTVQVGVTTERQEFVQLPLRKPTASERQEQVQRPVPQQQATGQPSQATGPERARITLVLGNQVRVRRDNNLEAYVEGSGTVVVGPDQVRVEGQYQVTQGFLEIQGRRFNIERATVTLNPQDPTNPTINAEAVYRAPEDVEVTAQFIGTVEKGELTLSSNPPLNQSQILTLIAFGSSEGPSGAQQNERSGAAGAALGVVGGTITGGLNEALNDLSSLDISTRIRSGESGVPAPELAVQISRDVTAELSYRLGLPGPGQNPDRTLLTVDYRFLPRWSVRTSVGDQGTSIVDFVWRFRY